MPSTGSGTPATAKFLDNTGLSYFWTKLKSLFVSKSGDTMTGELKINSGGLQSLPGMTAGGSSVTSDVYLAVTTDRGTIQLANGGSEGEWWSQKCGLQVYNNSAYKSIIEVNRSNNATFYGTVSGNASSATKATQDGNGLNIASNYVKKSSLATINGNSLDNGGTDIKVGFAPVLLWTNASPSTSFATQAIDLDLSEHEWAMISYKATADGDYINNAIFKIGTEGRLQAIASGMSRRVVSVTENYVQFNDGYNLAASGSSFAKSNTVCVPYQIYGL